MTYNEGDRVWLIANPEEGWQPQMATLIAKEDASYASGMWIAEVEPADDDDDGIREIHEDDIGGLA